MGEKKVPAPNAPCGSGRKYNSICEPKTFKHYKAPPASKSRPNTHRFTSKSVKPTLPPRQSQSRLRFENEPCEDSLECDDAPRSGDNVDRLTCTETQQSTESTSLDHDEGIAHPPLESVDCSISPKNTTALLPIPSDLQFSPQGSLLWSYFVVRGTKIFLCWDVGKFGLNELVNDPFTASSR
ncbi:hypothetical protein FOXYSP1_15505 [Fusarium oxysporum f. sp. phaseoli]